MGDMPRPILIRGFPDFLKSRYSSRILVQCMLNLVREGEEDYIEAIRYRRRLKSFENFLFFFVLSVSCWNIRFGAISNFRPTNSTSFRENLRNRVHLFRRL